MDQFNQSHFENVKQSVSYFYNLVLQAATFPLEKISFKKRYQIDENQFDSPNVDIVDYLQNAFGRKYSTQKLEKFCKYDDFVSFNHTFVFVKKNPEIYHVRWTVFCDHNRTYNQTLLMNLFISSKLDVLFARPTFRRGFRNFIKSKLDTIGDELQKTESFAVEGLVGGAEVAIAFDLPSKTGMESVDYSEKKHGPKMKMYLKLEITD